ncbi:hypothetical protein [Pseudomonas ogarae]|uniref:hypothetical protein n=1 Tax=Pseudomonas ogarae (strain DSM 112162 / CECT 30235 / F113) TaxID=1114970 RepID=UPI0019529116|nr:hypothetical protein [Pseudomonas ogarae]
MSDDEQAGKSKRGAVHRSPSFPAISLKTAIDRARTFYQHEKRSAANVVVASKHWGYSFSSSGGKQTLAALIAYGLMDDKGSGEQRHVQLTDLAFRILLDERSDSTERDKALYKAAVTPKLHAEIFGRWPDTLPSDPNLRHYLLIDKKFNENSVDDFIRQLRVTAEYAKVYSIESEDEDAPLELSASPLNDAQMSSHTADAPRESKEANVFLSAPQAVGYAPVVGGGEVRQDTFSLDEGQVVLQWPAKLSENSYEDLKDWLDLQLRKIKRNVRSDS